LLSRTTNWPIGWWVTRWFDDRRLKGCIRVGSAGRVSLGLPITVSRGPKPGAPAHILGSIPLRLGLQRKCLIVPRASQGAGRVSNKRRGGCPEALAEHARPVAWPLPKRQPPPRPPLVVLPRAMQSASRRRPAAEGKQGSQGLASVNPEGVRRALRRDASEGYPHLVSAIHP
jgi:hypothetical protein